MHNSTALQKSQTKNGRGNKVLFSLLMSVAVGVICMMLLVLLFAAIWSKVDLPSILPVFTYGAVAIGSLVTGLLTAMTFRQEKLMMCAISGAVLAVLLALCNLIFFREAITLWSLIKYLVAFGMPVAVSFCVKTNKKRRYKR